MKTPSLEEILKNPPPLKKPPGLKEQLLADVRLPRETVAPPGIWSLFRRWLPAGALSILSAVVIAGIVVETRRLEQASAKPEASAVKPNAAFSASGGDADSFRSQLERARRENQELKDLQPKVASMKQWVGRQAEVRSEHEKLRKEKAAASQSPVSPMMAQAREKAKRVQCVNNLKQAMVGTKIYANDHMEFYPKSFADLAGIIENPKVFICPEDLEEGEEVTFQSLSSKPTYKILRPGVKETDFSPEEPFILCPRHHNEARFDGAVMMKP